MCNMDITSSGLFNLYKRPKTAGRIYSQTEYIHMNTLENSWQNNCNSGLFRPLPIFNLIPDKHIAKYPLRMQTNIKKILMHVYICTHIYMV